MCGGVGHVDCETAVMCAVEVKVRVGLHQESALSPFFLTVADEVRQGSLWTMMFVDNIVICSEAVALEVEELRPTEQACALLSV